MQTYIEAHLRSEMTLEDLARAAGYSPEHACRLFKRLVGLSPFEYVRARRLSRAVLELRDARKRVLDVALEYAFGSHEGFTRAFSSQFGISPSRYRRTTPPLPLFQPRSAYLTYLREKKGDEPVDNIQTVFTQVINRPARKFILKRGREAQYYFEYCEEVGCDVWGVLESIKGALYEPIGAWLPEKLRKPGTSRYVQGVEVPLDYSGPIPEGMEIIELEPCQVMVFQGPPYPEEKMGEAISAMWKAIDSFNPTLYGWQWADEDAPRYQLAPIGERGYIEARPVKPLRK
ncbi:MAG TPA: AraC family transcriptional regulator [Firmicutes bacterium]|nr:AraC family transcriptional regulator [Candidatus Fermentithermobacillaceae bacterium]